MKKESPSEHFRWLERFGRAYEHADFESQSAAARQAREWGIEGISQPLISDWLLAVKDRDVHRTLRTQKLSALRRFVELLEAQAEDRRRVRQSRARTIVQEIRSKLDELEATLPRAAPEEVADAVGEAVEEQRPQRVSGRNGDAEGHEP